MAADQGSINDIRYDPAGALVSEVSAPIAEVSPGVGEAEVTTDPLPANIYTGKTHFADNGYYQAASVETQLVVYDPDRGFVTGGGFLCGGGLKTFGFCVKPSACEPWLPKGNLLFVDLSSLRKPLTVKATKFAWLVIPADQDIAYVAGVCKYNGNEGYSFYLTVEDKGWLWPQDTFRITVKDSTNQIVYDSQGTVTCGGLLIHY